VGSECGRWLSALTAGLRASWPVGHGQVERRGLFTEFPRWRGSRREVILIMTYVVVVFSILVQGLTVGPLTRRWLRLASRMPATAGRPRVPDGDLPG
jgi:hypothetical protein